MPEDANLQTTADVSGTPFHKKALEFIKDWGGIATVTIAVAYTFPFDAVSRYIKWQEHAVLETRKVLSDTGALLADQIMNSAKVPDWQNRSFLTNTYSTRIYNLLVNHLDMFAKAKSELRYSELYTLGSMLTMNGLVKEGLPYYDAALKKAEIEAPTVLPTIYREQGNALFTADPPYLTAARDSYQKALDRLNSPNLRDQSYYIYILNDLAAAELLRGDWKCGRDIISDTRESLKKLSVSDPNFAGLLQAAERHFATTNKRLAQSAVGCKVKYKVPELDVATVDPAIAMSFGLIPDVMHPQDLNSAFESVPLVPPDPRLPAPADVRPPGPAIKGGALLDR